MSKYAPLHVHSHFSLLDGLSKPKDIAKRCVEIGVESCAITDHGSLAGAVAVSQALKDKKIKPMLGVEFYICDEDPSLKKERKLSHIVLIAKNRQGWKELIQATSDANRPDNFYYKPRLNLEKLAGHIHGNVIGIAGHLGSLFSQYTFDEMGKVNPLYDKECVALTEKLQEIFGKENFFLEVQLIDQVNSPQSKIQAEIIREVAKKTGAPCVATPDAHYSKHEDAWDQYVLLCTKLETTIRQVTTKIVNDEEVGLDGFFRSTNYHIPSYDEMEAIHTPEELANTLHVADMCENYDITGLPQLPKFKTPNGESSAEYLRYLCREGWKTRFNEISKNMQSKGLTKDDYASRFEKEYKVFSEFELLSDYFLIVNDIVHHEIDAGYLTGAGRGSAAGSIVLYLLGVTQGDPIYYDLLFERFYNAGRNTKDRVSLPDVDMDFERSRRGVIIEYMRERFGRDKVAQMLTFTRMQGRSALKDVLRVHETCSFEEMNRITEFIPDEAEISDKLQEMREEDKQNGGDGEASIIEWALINHSKDLEQWCHMKDDGELDGPLAKRFEQAIRIEGTKRSQSKHASGIVISGPPLHEVCPMVYDKNTEEMICGMEMNDLEALGMTKFDVLGVSLLDKLHGVMNLVNTGKL